MIDLGSLRLNIGEGVPLNDFVNNPDQHHWEVYFEFPEDENRNSRATPTGKRYGSNDTFASIYDAICKKGMPFIDRYFYSEYQDSDIRLKGDMLLQSFNESIGITVEKINNKDNDVYEMSKNVRTNRVRLENAQERYDEYQQRVYAMQDEVNYLEENLVRTKSGGYDRRYSAYYDYLYYSDSLYKMYDELDRLERRVEIEQTRLDNSMERASDATQELRRIQSGVDTKIVSQYEEMADDFAEMVKNDIIDKAKNGILPLQRLPLAETTIRKRVKAGLRRFPRFWATGQLVSSIRITCTLV